VDRRLGGGTLERVLTTEFYKDRVLGVSKNAVCSTQVLWTATGNNLAFTPDMTRRSILIELDAAIEHPEQRRFSREIEAYTLEHRGALVSAAITIIQSYILAGCPHYFSNGETFPPPLGSYPGWDAMVRRPLLWLGEPDPMKTQATIRESDDGRISLASLLESWHSEFGGAAVQVRDVIQRAIAAEGDFRAAIFEVCLDKQNQPSSKLLGYFLRRNTGVVVNGYRLVRGQKTKMGIPWKVEVVENQKKLQIGSSSSPSSPPNEQTQSRQDFGVGDDAKLSSPQSQKLEELNHSELINAVTMQNHRHPTGTQLQQVFQPKEIKNGDDGDDISGYQEINAKNFDDDGWELVDDDDPGGIS
jgi:hypothetical protein